LQQKNEKPWLKDLLPVVGAPSSGAGGPTSIMGTSDGYLMTNENDLEILADFEEE